MDGDDERPTVTGAVLEDYVGGAWAFAKRENSRLVEETYSTPYMGYPFYSNKDTTDADGFLDDCVPMRGMYRWHLPDPIRFETDLRVTVQQIGVGRQGLFERQDDVSSVAYWYQAEPHHHFPALLAAELRRPR